MMTQKIVFDYFRGMEAEQYSFYRIPKILFTAEYFKELSCEAKVLYGFMLDRMSLSIKNQWFDSENRVYIIFTVEDVMKHLCCGKQKAVKILAELDSNKGIGLIEKKRRGLGKPNIIYVKQFIVKEIEQLRERQDSFAHLQGEPKSEEKNTSDSWSYGKVDSINNNYDTINYCSNKNNIGIRGEMKEGEGYENQNSIRENQIIQEVQKSNSNYTNINNTKFSNTNLIYPSKKYEIDGMEQLCLYKKIIKENLSYDCFIKNNHDKEIVEEIINLMADIMIMSDTEQIMIAGSRRSLPVVKSQFMKLRSDHLEYVITSFKQHTGKIHNIKAYLLASLYNAPMTIGHYYQAEVNHDLR